MSESILDTVKAGLGVPVAQTAFDSEILLHINAALGDLAQVNFGPPAGVFVLNKDQTWNSLTTHPEEKVAAKFRLALNQAKAYVTLKTKIAFDPPEIGVVMTALKDSAQEALWRVHATVDDEVKKEEIDNEA